MYYAHINSKDVLIGIDMSTISADEYGSEDVKNIEVDKELYDNKQKYGIEYYIYQDGEIIKNPNYENELFLKLFTELYKQVETEITQKHLAKQREPIIISLKPYFEPAPLDFIFYYDHESKADLKMLVPRMYTETEWEALMQQLWPTSNNPFSCPTVPVAFAKFTRLIQLNTKNPLESTFEYIIDFYTQEELDKLTNTIENYEIINYAKKADYQNQLLALKDTNNIEALKNLQQNIKY